MDGFHFIFPSYNPSFKSSPSCSHLA
jgi:hypothetical protein